MYFCIVLNRLLNLLLTDVAWRLISPFFVPASIFQCLRFNYKSRGVMDRPIQLLGNNPLISDCSESFISFTTVNNIMSLYIVCIINRLKEIPGNLFYTATKLFDA